MFVSQNFSAASDVPSASVGLLKVRAFADGNAFVHGVYFRKGASGFEGLRVSEPVDSQLASMNKAKPQTFSVTFDGQTLGRVALESAYRVADKTVPEAVKKKFAWLEEKHRPKILVTVSSPRFSDPEGWTRTDSEKHGLGLSGLRAQLEDLTQGCIKEFGKSPLTNVDVKTFTVARTYVSKQQNRSLVEIRNPICLGWKGTPTEHNERLSTVWLFRNGSEGQWKKVFGPDLIDIGDFDGDGVSEALFYRSDEQTAPSAEFYLYDLKNFSVIATAYDGGY